jgi:hypothetical protein
MGGRGGAPRTNLATAVAQAAARAEAATSPEAQIRQAYETLAVKPGAWVRLTAIRDAVGGEKSAADEALRDLANSGGAEFIPIANLKSLSPADRESAIKVGGELKHLIRIER